MPDPVISEIASAIQVRHIQTPLSAATNFTRLSHVGEVAARMTQHKYDVTPIFPATPDPTDLHATDPDGTLWRADLVHLRPGDEIESVVRPLTSSTLIDSNASLVKLLDRFRQAHRFMLVVGGRGLEGIVTPFDINKQAGRTHLFMQISALEIALSDRVRAANHTDDEVLRCVPRDRAKMAKGRLVKKQERDEATDLVAALDFQDLLTIQRATADVEVLTALKDEEIEGLVEFRNRVMHAVLEPAGDDSERLEQLLRQTAMVACLLDGLEETA